MYNMLNRTQQLILDAEGLECSGASAEVVNKRRVGAARLLEQRARELITHGNPLGFTDLFAAITYYTKAGWKEQAEQLFSFGERHVDDYGPESSANIRAEFQRLAADLGSPGLQ